MSGPGFRHICAWCLKETGPAEIAGSHGICWACLEAEFPEIALEIERRENAKNGWV